MGWLSSPILLIATAPKWKNLLHRALIDGLIRRLDYLKYLSDGTPQGEARIENVRELLTVAAEYQEIGLAGFLEEVALVSDLDRADFGNNAVTLMTIACRQRFGISQWSL
jgi:DNA helicase-2/ATP-dependent DNA helicase PcrA